MQPLWFVTIGVFDGVHRGHRAVLDPLVTGARAEGARTGVITFDPHPARVVAPAHEPRLLTPGSEKFRLLMEAGIERVLALRFDRAFSELSAREFLTRCVLVQFPSPRLFVGHDQRFGRGREAGREEIERLGSELGFEVREIPPFTLDGGIVSSTRIRHAVERADFEEARRALGRPFALTAPVVRGDARGASLGFPTANLGLAREQCLPPRGVYAGWTKIEGKAMPSVANIGVRPTFDGGELRVEVYVLDFTGDLLGKTVDFEPAARLRDEKKFSNIKELTEAIHNDVEVARGLLGPSTEQSGNAPEPPKMP